MASLTPAEIEAVARSAMAHLPESYFTLRSAERKSAANTSAALWKALGLTNGLTTHTYTRAEKRLLARLRKKKRLLF